MDLTLHNVVETRLELKKFLTFTALKLIATDKDGIEYVVNLFADGDQFPMPSLTIKPDVV